MKKLLLFFTAICIHIMLFAQSPVQITGSLEGLKSTQPVKLFKIVNGTSKEIATSTPQGDGLQFGFTFYPEYEGFYGVGLGNEGSPNNNFKFYFKPGDRLDFAITYNDGSLSYRLKEDVNNKENILLTEWHDLVFPLEDKAINFMGKNSTYVDYFPQQEEVVAKAKTFMQGKSSGNIKFDRLLAETIQWDLAMFATNFLNTPRSAHPAVEEYSPFYATLKPEEYTQNTVSVYAQPYGMRTLDALVRIQQRLAGVKVYTGVEGATDYFKYVENDTLKGDILLNFMSSVKTSDAFEEYNQAFGQYLVTASQQDRSKAILYPLLEYKPGTDAYPFSYPDNKGNTVTLSSLKGKVVLVDVWATWCGPCRAQFPHLRQLEEDMEGKDVAIVSLSTDAEKDKDKWMKMIVDEKLGGIQLYAGQGNEFSKYYKINAIPRFLVFDKYGKIVTVDAPRPSDPALKELLLRELAR